MRDELPAFDALVSIGLTPAMAQRIASQPEPPAPGGGRSSAMRVVELQRDRLTVHDGDSTTAVRMWPPLLQQLQADDEAMAVGDWVWVGADASGDGWVVARVPPQSSLVRLANDGSRQALVANVDTALLVMGLDNDFHPRRLERYLTLVRMAGIDAVVVLTKVDLAAEPAASEAQVRALLRPSEAVVALDGRSADAVTALRPWLGRGHTLVLLGSSGAGKSTLTNTLVGLAGADAQATGGLRRGDGRGRHTTTARTLHRTAVGACIVDTPGLRTLRLDAELHEVRSAFDDVERLALACRFRDCAHRDEPGCAVRAALPAARLANYHKLLREVRRDSMTALDRRAALQLCKARSRAARAHMAAKGR